MKDLPFYVPIVFILTTFLAIIILTWTVYNTSENSNKTKRKANLTFLTCLIWVSIQAMISMKEVYSEHLNMLPPLIFLIGILPNFLVMAFLFFTQKGKVFIDSLPLYNLTFLNLVRIPVEFVLLWLSLDHLIPTIMTFEGWNFDILAGLTAPFIIYFGYKKNRIGKTGLIIWNILGIALLTFIVITGVLSAPFPMQQLAFDQPNVGLLVFPFSWLPTFIVPLVFFGHFVSLRQLLNK